MFPGRYCGEPEEGIHTVKSGEYYFGDEVHYKCLPTYKYASGKTVRMCQADGTWSGQPAVCQSEFDTYYSLGCANANK